MGSEAEAGVSVGKVDGGEVLEVAEGGHMSQHSSSRGAGLARRDRLGLEKKEELAKTSSLVLKRWRR